jgi:hypothetical protein
MIASQLVLLSKVRHSLWKREVNTGYSWQKMGMKLQEVRTGKSHQSWSRQPPFSKPSNPVAKLTNRNRPCFSSLAHSWTCAKLQAWGEKTPADSLSRWPASAHGNYLAFRTLLVGWVHEDPSINQGAVHIGHHRTHIPGPIGSTAILESRKGKRQDAVGLATHLTSIMVTRPSWCSLCIAGPRLSIH